MSSKPDSSKSLLPESLSQSEPFVYGHASDELGGPVTVTREGESKSGQEQRRLRKLVKENYCNYELGRIADAFEHIADIAERFYDKLYPTRDVQPAGIGVAKYPNPEKDQPERPLPGEDLTEGLGPREKALAAKLLDKQQRKTGRSQQKDRGTASVGP